MTELGPRAKELIAFTRARSEPTEADVRRIEAALDAKIAAASVGPPHAPVTAPRTSTPLTSLMLKVIAGALLLGVAGAAYVLWRPAMRALPARIPSDRLSNPASANRPAPIAPVSPVTPWASAAPSAPDVPTVDIDALPRAPLATPRRASAPEARAADLSAELALIQSAQRALAARDPSRAVALLDEHARLFPRGAMVEERSAARVLALCDLHRDEDARAEATAFLRAHPQSPQVAAIQRSCARQKE